MAFAYLPEVKGLAQAALKPLDDHALEVLVYHHIVALLSTLPLVKVFGHTSVDHAPENLAAAIFARTHGSLSLDLYVFVEGVDGWLVVALKCFSHHDQFFLLFAHAKGVEANFYCGLVAFFLKAEDAHVGREDKLSVLI